jgi:hypothetical protein
MQVHEESSLVGYNHTKEREEFPRNVLPPSSGSQAEYYMGCEYGGCENLKSCKLNFSPCFSHDNVVSRVTRLLASKTEHHCSILGRDKGFFSSSKCLDWLWHSSSLQFSAFWFPGGKAARV